MTDNPKGSTEFLKPCPRCGTPDREVAIGFILCPSCFDLETKEIAERWKAEETWTRLDNDQHD